MKLFLFLCLLTISLISKPLTLSKSESETFLLLPYGTKIINRFNNLNTLFDELDNSSIDKKLNRVNSFVNRIIPTRDISNGKQTDIWLTPKEFLIEGRGDCEDYAILKYFILLELGIPKDRLWFGVVKTNNTVEYHMVLFYFYDDNLPPRVLDNLSWKILELDKRSDLKPILIFNEKEARVLENSILSKRISYPKGIGQKFKNLILKILK